MQGYLEGNWALWGYVRVVRGLYIGIMEKKMETTSEE